uniref:Mix paired homeobox n=1 Tax=Xenopus tropicalis TaxID=8364 RepID=A0A6I8SQC8_XENTR
MDSFSQQLEDFYPSCFSARSNPAAFPDPPAQHLAMSLGTAQKDFQEASLKVHVHSANDHQTPGSQKPNSPPKQEMVSPVSSADVTLGSQRRKRTFYSQNKLDVLEQFFQTNMYPDIHQRENLAKRIYIPESRVQVWFQNRRAKVRRQGAKATKPVLAGHHYSSTFGATRSMFPSAPAPNSSSHPMATARAQAQPMKDSQANKFHQSQGFLPYPDSSCDVSRQRFLLSQATPGTYHLPQTSSNIYNQNGKPHNPLWNQQPLYTDMMEKVLDLSRRPEQMPVQPMYSTQTHKNTKSVVHGSTTLSHHSHMSLFANQDPCNMPTTQGGTYGHVSPISDSGVSDTSPEPTSDWEENVCVLLHL